MKNESRRNFLKKNLLGFSGAALLPGTIENTYTESFTQRSGSDLPTRILGKAGLEVPIISMGVEGASAAGFIKAAYEAGIRMFFSATYYGEGNNEKLLGDVVRNLPRDALIIGSAIIPKGVDYNGGMYTGKSTYEDQIKTAEDSLKRFGMDYLDFMLLPYAAKRESIFFEPLLRAMEDLKKQGKTRFVGIATHSFQDEAIRAATDTKVYDLIMTGYSFRDGNLQEINDAIAYAAKAGIGVVGMKAQAGAYWDRERTQPINSDAALKWVLQNKNITSVVSGMTNFSELQKNIALIKGNLDLTDEDKKDLKLVSNETTPGLYCKQCRQCMVQCTHKLDIPTIMRSYMYAYGYRNPEKARYTLENAVVPGQSCVDCFTCNVKCPAGFNVKQKILDIVRLKDVPEDFLRI